MLSIVFWYHFSSPEVSLSSTVSSRCLKFVSEKPRLYIFFVILWVFIQTSFFHILNYLHVFPFRVRFLLGGRHGDFKFLPPSSYAPCYEALLPKEKMKVEPVKEYKRDVEGVRDLLGTTQLTSQASFIPTPVETSQVRSLWGSRCCYRLDQFLKMFYLFSFRL